MSQQQNLKLVRKYLRAVEQMAGGEAMAKFYTPDAVQIELPNQLNPNGGRSDVAKLLARAAKVPELLRSQKFEIVSEMAQGARVIVEAVWTGVMAVPFGTARPGATMKAHFAMFFQIENGRIKSQRNYDCFEPW